MSIHLNKHFNEIIGNHVFFIAIVWAYFERIESDGVGSISKIKINQIINSLFWKMSEKEFYSFSMRINEGKSSSIIHIINGLC